MPRRHCCPPVLSLIPGLQMKTPAPLLTASPSLGKPGWKVRFGGGGGGHSLSSVVLASLPISWLSWHKETPELFPRIALTTHTGVVSFTTIQLLTEQSSHPLLHLHYFGKIKKLLIFFPNVEQHTYLWEPFGVHLTWVFTHLKWLCHLKKYIQLQVEDVLWENARRSFLQVLQF